MGDIPLWLWVVVGVMAVGSIAVAIWVGMAVKSGSVVGEMPVQGDAVLGIVSGTEYVIGDAGQVIAEVRAMNGSNLQSNCTISIWYPDKSSFLVAQTADSASGNYYVNFTAPNVTGVYEYRASCLVARNNKTVVGSKSFHISQGRMRAWVTP